MSHKIRKAMKDRDGAYLLSGTVDVDDSFFGAARVGSKRGRGTEKTAVVFGVSLDQKGRPEYLKAKVVETVDGEILTIFAQENIASGARLSSDGLSSYRKRGKCGYIHDPQHFYHQPRRFQHIPFPQHGRRDV
jgi:hypothetical protein